VLPVFLGYYHLSRLGAFLGLAISLNRSHSLSQARLEVQDSVSPFFRC